MNKVTGVRCGECLHTGLCKMEENFVKLGHTFNDVLDQDEHAEFSAEVKCEKFKKARVRSGDVKEIR